MATKLIFLFISLFLLRLPLSSATAVAATNTNNNLRIAADVLSDSGYLSMSLTLQLFSKSLTTHSHSHSHSPSSSLTLFAPSDAAFAVSGQPSLSLLQLHFSPLFLTLQSLKTQPCNSTVPTFSPNHSLVITSNDCDVYLNAIKIHPSPLYVDGSLIIFGIDEFFNQNYSGSAPTTRSKNDPNPDCGLSFNGSVNAFKNVSEVLRSKGYSFTAAFLELQLLGFNKKSKNPNFLTFFAPGDDAMMGFIGNLSEYSSLLFRHLVNCKILWSELVSFDYDRGDLVMGTFLEGFKIIVTKSEDGVLMLNGVELTSPDVYYSDRLVVHGIAEVLVVPKRQEKLPADQQASSEIHEQRTAPDHGEF